ncbi:MAG: hypothetical protein B7Z06_05410 [Flavobacteriales bacterium 32-35-8]|nr:MAG: hypothetical protein B7Z06_05410 [Flavobacteriales bacterium 32-35-8]
MKKVVIIIIALIFIPLGCKTESKFENKKEYLRWVGDIEQNNEIDNSNFKVCNGDEKIFQYFNLGEGPRYNKEKTTILETFKVKYKPIKSKIQNGLIRIRFVVNCEGKAGRFRTLQSDYDYKEIEFDKRIVSQLIEITKEIDNWEILFRDEMPVDYYFYLIFKISDGRITEILP